MGSCPVGSSAGEGSQWSDGNLREDDHDLAQLRNEPGKFPADVRAVAGRPPLPSMGRDGS
ncbi:hypothetical protein MES4922_110294 [Mesorhizobium ventifaucium]|uniref:Uncharacterized protein n=1 Tax=Mesorhizobium ventifaucium TaxID=666020 RepID=A0ABM9DEA9_9HYPH|nr:hypothetical protein MES4922_110294 [Mesorhizobium ventifaucium]